jgi:hypothetical protein
VPMAGWRTPGGASASGDRPSTGITRRVVRGEAVEPLIRQAALTAEGGPLEPFPYRKRVSAHKPAGAGRVAGSNPVSPIATRKLQRSAVTCKIPANYTNRGCNGVQARPPLNRPVSELSGAIREQPAPENSERGSERLELGSGRTIEVRAYLAALRLQTHTRAGQARRRIRPNKTPGRHQKNAADRGCEGMTREQDARDVGG